MNTKNANTDKKIKLHNPKAYAPAVYIPCWLIQIPSSKLSHGAKIVYGRLAQWSNAKCQVHRSTKQLCDELGMHSRMIERYLKELRDAALIGTYQIQEGGINHFEFYDHDWMRDPIHPSLCYSENRPENRPVDVGNRLDYSENRPENRPTEKNRPTDENRPENRPEKMTEPLSTKDIEPSGTPPTYMSVPPDIYVGTPPTYMSGLKYKEIKRNKKKPNPFGDLAALKPTPLPENHAGAAKSPERDFSFSLADTKQNHYKDDELFMSFYKHYPNKQKPSVAHKEFLKHEPNKSFVKMIVNDIAKRMQNNWHGRDKSKIPYPATYLRNCEWEGEIYAPQLKTVNKSTAETMHWQ